MSASSSTMHNPPSVSSVETPLTEHDDVSVTASDDIDIRSSQSTTTEPSVTEQDQTNDDKPPPTSSPKSLSPTAQRGPVQLLRRQQQNPSSGTATPASRQSTPTNSSDVRQPSPSRADSAPQTPGRDAVDPSLLEAFANPMNRQYLLQLEGSLNNFVTQSRSDTMELPPTNSFFRCLAHKMADHYKLQHVAESGHVVLFRSPYARIPETRLSELSKTVRTSGSSASSTIAPEDGVPTTVSAPEIKQIMKRVPGKSARDGEDDAKSESSQSQLLSHEERQAKYEQTRARIFSDYVASQGSEVPEKGSDAGSETSSMRREKSLHRSDSFQTRQQFAREATSYSSYAAALTGQQPPPQQQPSQPLSPPTGPYPYPPPPPPQGYSGYPPYPPSQYPQQPYPYPPPPMSQSSRDPQSRDPSRPESRTSSPAINRNDSPGFQPNPFAREFVPTGASGGGSGNSRPPPRPRTSLTPPILPRNSTPPTTTGSQQVKKTASFDHGRPITPTPGYPRSQSASSMRQQPQPPLPPPPHQPYSTPPVYSQGYGPPPPQASQTLPYPPPMLLTARQYEWGPAVTTGTVRYIANGQPIPPQVLPYRAHPMPMPPPKPLYNYPAPSAIQPRNGNGSQEVENTQQGQIENNVKEKMEAMKVAEDGNGDVSSTGQSK